MYGIGIDIIELSRMRETIQRSGTVFLKRVFSDNEIQKANTVNHPVNYFASAFATKEAVFKALSLNWEDGIKLPDIEVDRGEFGEPLVRLCGTIKSHARNNRYNQILVSLSYETNLAIAMVVATK